MKELIKFSQNLISSGEKNYQFFDTKTSSLRAFVEELCDQHTSIRSYRHGAIFRDNFLMEQYFWKLFFQIGGIWRGAPCNTKHDQLICDGYDSRAKKPVLELRQFQILRLTFGDPPFGGVTYGGAEV